MRNKFNWLYIRSLILNNFVYKLASIFIAFFVWYIVLGEEVLETSMKLNVRIIVDEDYLVEDGPLRVKDITLKGPRAFMPAMTNKPLEVIIAIPKGKVGTFRQRIDKEMIPSLDRRLNITVHDEYITFLVDRKYIRVLPVKEIFVGSAADGFMISRTVVEPKNVRVTGLRSVVSRLNHIQTEPIDITGIKNSQSYEVSISVPERVGKEGVAAESVKVKVEVSENKVNQTFNNVPIQVVGSEFLATTRPKFVSIVIQGTSAVLEFIKKDDLSATIDLRDQKPGKLDREIQVKIPPDTVLIETTPKSAAVEIYNVRKSD
ncbi:MAG: hypothetical protein KBD78_12340 [Oligoflexales bacterium]|nr:hypothetical protein [Oligoflexales bacterium]